MTAIDDRQVSEGFIETLSEQKQEVVLHMHHVLAEHIMFWRKMQIDIAIFITTAILALTGYLLSQDHITVQVTVGSCAILSLLGLVGGRISRYIAAHIYEQEAIIVKLDRLNRLFDDDVYIKGDSIYPKTWSSYGTKKWKEPVIEFCIILQLLLPIPVAALVLVLKS